MKRTNTTCPVNRVKWICPDRRGTPSVPPILIYNWSPGLDPGAGDLRGGRARLYQPPHLLLGIAKLGFRVSTADTDL